MALPSFKMDALCACAPLELRSRDFRPPAPQDGPDPAPASDMATSSDGPGGGPAASPAAAATRGAFRPGPDPLGFGRGGGRVADRSTGRRVPGTRGPVTGGQLSPGNASTPTPSPQVRRPEACPGPAAPGAEHHRGTGDHAAAPGYRPRPLPPQPGVLPGRPQPRRRSDATGCLRDSPLPLSIGGGVPGHSAGRPSVGSTVGSVPSTHTDACPHLDKSKFAAPLDMPGAPHLPRRAAPRPADLDTPPPVSPCFF